MKILFLAITTLTILSLGCDNRTYENNRENMEPTSDATPTMDDTTLAFVSATSMVDHLVAIENIINYCDSHDFPEIARRLHDIKLLYTSDVMTAIDREDFREASNAWQKINFNYTKVAGVYERIDSTPEELKGLWDTWIDHRGIMNEHIAAWSRK